MLDLLQRPHRDDHSMLHAREGTKVRRGSHDNVSLVLDHCTRVQ